MRRAALFVVALAAAFLLLSAGPASAHPLGNFTINTYSGLEIGTDHIALDVVVDMAEIPTLQRKGEMERPEYAAGECRRLLGQVDLRVDGAPVGLVLRSSDLTFPAGQAGLRTSRLECAMNGTTSERAGPRRVSFTNANFTDRVGWREITAAGDGTTLVESDVPSRSISKRLTNYPQDLLSSPLDRRSATVLVRAGGPTAAAGPGSTDDRGGTSALPRGVDRATRAFTSFVGRQDLTLGFAALAAAASVVLGAIHALAPGHGKTVMAAYLVGQRGSFRQAMVVAFAVTATHTAGVLALGVAISASAVVAPERLYPWLGAASGALLAVIGAGILVRVVRARRHEYHHEHGHGHVHSHGGQLHHHGPVGGEQLMSWRGLLGMGFVGGLLPSPSAVVVLLGAIALGQAWFGVALVILYGMGMAATLVGAGLLLLRARRALDRKATGLRPSRLLSAASQLVPAATAVFIVVVGLYLAAQGAAKI